MTNKLKPILDRIYCVCRAWDATLPISSSFSDIRLFIPRDKCYYGGSPRRVVRGGDHKSSGQTMTWTMGWMSQSGARRAPIGRYFETTLLDVCTTPTALQAVPEWLQ